MPTKRLSKTVKLINVVREKNNGITQPSGAATPRNSDAHERVAVPQALCALREHTRPRPKSGKAVLTPGHAWFLNRAKRSDGSDTTPARNAPVSPCEPLCAILLAKARVYPLSPVKTNVNRLCECDLKPLWKGLSPCRMGRTFSVFQADQAVSGGKQDSRRSLLKRTLRRLWTMCERARRILLRRWETEPLGMRVSLPTMSRFGGFRPLFTRSIKAQDKRPQSQAPAARPQSPAVRGFPRF